MVENGVAGRVPVDLAHGDGIRYHRVRLVWHEYSSLVDLLGTHCGPNAVLSLASGVDGFGSWGPQRPRTVHLAGGASVRRGRYDGVRRSVRALR